MMLKYALLGAAMVMTAPALAQTAPAAQPAPTATTPDTSMTAEPATTPQTAAPADPATAAPAEIAAQPAPGPDQVAPVVDSQFATYDKDADGKLNEAEFGAWMVALKAQTDPATDANAPAIKLWNKAAFAQADTDKSKSVTKTELTGFLTPAAKS